MIIAELTKFFLHFPQIFFPTGNFSRNCSCFRDKSPLRPWFLQDLLLFSGHFSPHGVFSPGLAVKTRMFCCHLRSLSRFCGVIRDIFFPRRSLSGNFSVFRDISPAAEFVPEFQRFPGHYSISMIFRAGLRPNSRSKVVYKEPPCGKQGISTPLNKHSSQKIVITKNKHLKP